MPPPKDDTKPTKGDAGLSLRLRRSGAGAEDTAEVASSDLRKRLILALAETRDADYAPRSYPVLAADRGGRAVSTDSRPPVLRMRSGASVSVQEAVAAVATGVVPPAPPKSVTPIAPPTGRPMMNQKAEAPPAQPASAPAQSGAPLTVRRKLEVRAGAAPASMPSAPPVLIGAPAFTTPAPLIPLPIDAALGGKASAFPFPVAPKPGAKVEAKAPPPRKKNAPVGVGAILVSLCLVLFLAGLFWMQRGDAAAEKAGVTAVAETAPSASIDASSTAAQPVVNETPSPTPVLEVAKLATVSSSVAWEMADAGWAGTSVVNYTPTVPAVDLAASATTPSTQPTPPKPSAQVAAVNPAVASEAKAPAPAHTNKANVKPAAAPSRPEPSKAFQVFVDSLKVSGVLQQTPVRAIIDGGTVFAGDMIEPTQGIRLVGANFEQRELIFEDKTRAQVKIFY